ncbi:uncharacterized protein EV154DRAFT_194688 [Mucor mucedo]|uniref:uncharacterized protein n=1 Tax=Mucor mucedo TaxID=29922 RepID=UPI00221F7B62|nr:uncharacterized protein EV154DRAFT_194688 [Mucor mucedo]KAI7863744.1 hypothetical protein EV154DRAFT_194688 [Mucor mucedo]
MPLSGQRLNSINKFRASQKDKETSLTKTKVRVAFSVISKDLIGIKAEQNLTLDPVIANIEHIEWSAKYGQWTIPASVPMYNLALSSLPTDTPNLLIDIDPIPTALLDSIIQRTLSAQNAGQRDLSDLSYMESKWTEFVGSETWTKMGSSIQRNAVRVGIERNCRILFGNENGIGSVQQALALTKVYEEEWPVMVACPGILCQTWKREVMSFLDLDEEEVCIMDPKLPKSEAFKQTTTMKRKRKEPSVRMSYAKKMQQRLEGAYESDSEEEEEEDEYTTTNNVKFYIASHEHTAKRRNEIRAQKFNIMLCADSHYLKSWTKGESKFICTLLQSHSKSILISDSAQSCLPVNMYTQLQAVAPVMFPKFEEFAKRYCDPKSSVFGPTHNGRCNQYEFTYLLDTNIWYCPRLDELKPEFPDYVRQNVCFSIKKNAQLSKQVESLDIGSGLDLEEKIDLIEELHKKTGEAKKDGINEYIAYVLETYKRPKVAFIYRNEQVLRNLEECLKSKRSKFVNLNNYDSATETCDNYNKSHAVQMILIDMNLEGLDVSLHCVDIVVFVELPLEMAKLYEVESFFKNNARKGPLSIKYLMALKTIDDYLWPLIQQ